MLARARWVLVALCLVLLVQVRAAADSVVPPGVDPKKYEEFVNNIEKLLNLQDPSISTWTLDQCQQMERLVEANDALGITLPPDNAVVRAQNVLVERMHDHCRILSLAAGEDVVLLRVGKNPSNPLFSGLNTLKPSDLDQTLVGRGAEKARLGHLHAADTRFGPRFKEITQTNLALADGTIAAIHLSDVRGAYATAMIDPEMHRTYSGLQFVEDLMIDSGEIITRDKATGNLVTKTLSDFGKDRGAFIEYANDLFAKAGSEMRFGRRQTGFCLGLMTDISNQMWMNVAREQAKPGDVKARAPENHVKKYMERYAAKAKDIMKMDLKTDMSYRRVMALVEECHTNPQAWEKLAEATRTFEQNMWMLASQLQAAEYEKAKAAGLIQRAAAILLDTEGALTNVEQMKASKFGAPTAAPEATLGELAQVARKVLAEEPLTGGPGFWSLGIRAGVMSRAKMLEYVKANKNAVFFQIGMSLFTLADALKSEAEGQKGALEKAARAEALNAVCYNGIPMALEFVGYSTAAGVLGWGGGLLGLEDYGLKTYGDYYHERLTGMWVTPKICARLAGVTPEGKRTNAPDVITTLGDTLTDADLLAPNGYVDGTYSDGTRDGAVLRVSHEASGKIVIEELDPIAAVAEAAWRARTALGTTPGGAIGSLPPNPVRSMKAMMPGEVIAERRLSRAFDLLRQAWVARKTPLGPRTKSFDPTRLEQPYRLSEKLEFAHEVDPREIVYYWQRYNDAVLKSAVQFNPATSVGQSGERAAMEVELGEAATRQFLIGMARLAAEADAASAAYARMGPMALQAHLDAGLVLHVDGRDLPRAEVEQRISELTLAACRGVDSPEATQMWMDWLRKHWDRPDLPKPGEGDVVVNSLTAEREPGAENRWYRLVLKYTVRKQPPGGLDFKLVAKEADDRVSSVPNYMDPENDSRLFEVGSKTAIFSYPAASKGEPRTVSIVFMTGVKNPKTGMQEDQALTTAGPVVIPGLPVRSWAFEKMEWTGTKSYSKKSYRDTYKFDVKAEETSISITGRVDNEEGAWSMRGIKIGPLPRDIVEDKEVGFWVDRVQSDHYYKDPSDGQDHAAGGFLVEPMQGAQGVFVEVKGTDEQTLSVQPGAFRGEDAEAKQIETAPLPAFDEENPWRAPRLYSVDVYEYDTHHQRLAVRAVVRVSPPGEKAFDITVTWTYRLTDVMPVVPIKPWTRTGSGAATSATGAPPAVPAPAPKPTPPLSPGIPNGRR